MSKTYQYSGLTPELHQRLVSEHAALRKTHKKGSYKQFFQEVKQCNELQARIIYQAFNAAVVERARISPATVDRLEGIISDELFDDLQDYLSTNYTRGKTTKPVLDKTNAGLPEHLFKRFREEVEELRKGHPNGLNNYIRYAKDCDQKNANRTQNALNLCYAEKAALTPLKAIQMEGLLSRKLFSEIIDFVFNNYEWAERLDDEVDRIILKYRTKGKVGRNKITVRKAVYKAYALGV
jgi:orf235 gp